MNTPRRFLLSVAILTVLLSYCRAADLTPKQRVDIGLIYGAKSKNPSSTDVQACLDSARGTSEWNRITAPVVRDLLDPQVTREEWARSTMAAMPQMRAVVMKMLANARLVSDEGIAKTLLPLAEVHREMLDAYTLIAFAMNAGEKEKVDELTSGLRTLGEKKTALGISVVQRTRQYLGPESFDKALDESVKVSSSSAQNAEMTKGNQGKAFYDAFVCATLAQKAGDRSEAERLLQWGLKTGREFLRNQNLLSPEEVTALPTAVALMSEGASHDFVLGRMYEFAAAEAIRLLPKREGGFGMWEEKERNAAKVLLAQRRPAAYKIKN